MRREGTRWIVIATAALAAALLAACGSSDAGSTSSGGETSTSKSGGSPKANVDVPLKVSGGGSDQFRTKGGDNSIQEFGEESAESELEEAAEAVHSFYVSRAEGDWKGACSHISKSMLERLEQLAKSSTELEDTSCPPFLEAFTSDLSDAEWREIATIDAGSLRLEGDQGFLIYHGAAGTDYAIPLALEDGEWKVASLSATTLG